MSSASTSTFFPCAIPNHCNQVFNSPIECDLHGLLALKACFESGELSSGFLVAPGEGPRNVVDDLPDYEDFLDTCYGNQKENGEDSGSSSGSEDEMMDSEEDDSWEGAGLWADMSTVNISDHFDLEAPNEPLTSAAVAWEYIIDCDYRECFDIDEVSVGLSHPPKPAKQAAKKIVTCEHQDQEMAVETR